ncbi:MAG TPA: hypothetical protein VFC01_29150 [Mycobacterium sp.]|nr:hypothetical protein [Mycobacterium sp.]
MNRPAAPQAAAASNACPDCRAAAVRLGGISGWVCHSHPGKPKRWIIRRYFGRFNPSRSNHWVFGDIASGAYLPLMAWTPIVRYRKVTGGYPLIIRADRLLEPMARQKTAAA